MLTEKQITAIQDCPGTSFWLKDAIETSTDRDIVDAISDAEVLVKVLKSRLEWMRPAGKIPAWIKDHT